MTEQEREALPPLIDLLARWEDSNGTMAAIMDDEWAALCDKVRKACIEQSPRQLRNEWQARAALATQGVPEAMATVIAAMKADPDYAWSWHCNVAMSFVDAGGDHYTANQGAARFMRLLAGVEPAHELPAPPKVPMAAQGVPADPCLVLWQAMNEAEKVGNRTDDKLIVEFLRRAGYRIAATPPASAPEATPAQAQQAPEATPAQAQQSEPYAHIVELPSEYSGLTKFFTAPSDPRGFPVYRHPPKAEAKPLTDEQIVDLLYPIYDGLPSLTPITDTKVARATEAACAEAWGVKLAGIGACTGNKWEGWKPVYLAAPAAQAQQAKPLTNAQFERLYNNLPPSIQQDARSRLAFIRIGRAVEAAHGIGASTGGGNG